MFTSDQLLRRSVLSCMLWEDTFYESGVSIANRISELVKEVDPKLVMSLAIEAREKFKLRSVPIFLMANLVKIHKGSKLIGDTITRVIQRPDEMSKFLELYWADGKKPIPAQAKRGLANAFHKFDEYQLSKWNRDGKIKLRDVMRLTHPTPKDDVQDALWSRLISDELATPETWEVRLSSGEDKKNVWEDLLTHNKMGALAVLRNLRNFSRDDVQPDIIKQALNEMKVDRVLPYRFLAAARFVGSQYNEHLENAMFRCLKNAKKLHNKTVLLVDVSGSMDWGLARNAEVFHRQTPENEVNRIDVACGLAILLREICNDVEIYTFSDRTVPVADARGFALKNLIYTSQAHRSTMLGQSISYLSNKINSSERTIVITDEQATDRVDKVDTEKKLYLINVAPYQTGIEYDNWIRINGFSEAVIDWIQEYEKESLNGFISEIEQILFANL